MLQNDPTKIRLGPPSKNEPTRPDPKPSSRLKSDSKVDSQESHVYSSSFQGCHIFRRSMIQNINFH